MIDACIDTGRDSDRPALCKQAMHAARKSYKCCECGSAINPGDQYERTTGIWDGDWETYRTCRICAAVRRDFCESYIFGTLWEEMWETHGLGFDRINEDWSGYELSDEELRTFSTIQDLMPGDPLGSAMERREG